MVLPVANDVLGIAVKMPGFDRFLVNCQNGHERLRRIRDKSKRGLDKAGRHRFGLSVGFPIRQAGRHHMAIREKSGRMAKKKWVPKDLIDRIFHSS